MTKEKSNCPNCHSALAANDEFCAKCGQKRIPAKLKAKEFLLETASTLVNFDSKAWQTILNAFIPGKITNDYIAGQRNKYIHPVRFFILTFVLAFAFLGNSKINDGEPLVASKNELLLKKGHHKQLHSLRNEANELLADSLIQELDKNLASSDSISLLIIFPCDSIREISDQDSFSIKSEGSSFNLMGHSLKIPVSEIDKNDLTPIFKKYQVTSWIDTRMLEQQVKFLHNPGLYTLFLFSMMTWMMLLIQPIFAIFLKLFFYKGFYYSDHLVHLLYGHGSIFLAFVVLWIFDGILSPIGLSLDSLQVIIYMVAIPWLFVSLLKVYPNRRWRVVLSSLPLFFIYVIHIFTIMLVTMALSFAFF